MKKLLLLLVPLLFLVGCSSSGGSAPAATAAATTAAVTTDVIVGKMQVCSSEEGKVLRGQDCFRPTLNPNPDKSQPLWMQRIDFSGPPAWVENTVWELTIRTPQGTTYIIETPFHGTPEPVLGQSWP